MGNLKQGVTGLIPLKRSRGIISARRYVASTNECRWPHPHEATSLSSYIGRAPRLYDGETPSPDINVELRELLWTGRFRKQIRLTLGAGHIRKLQSPLPSSSAAFRRRGTICGRVVRFACDVQPETEMANATFPSRSNTGAACDESPRIASSKSQDPFLPRM